MTPVNNNLKSLLPKNKPLTSGKEYWPFNIADNQAFTIGEVKERLQSEFPNISISKLRFLEDNGLIFPKRGSNGYRRYSMQDIIRIEFILKSQRDYFWSLEIIKKRLSSLDKQEVEASELIAGYTTDYLKADYEAKISDNLTVDNLADVTGLSVEAIEDILIKLKKNIHDIRKNAKLYILFFKKWHMLKNSGLSTEHLNLIVRNISRNNDVWKLTEKNKEDFILFQDLLFSLL